MKQNNGVLINIFKCRNVSKRESSYWKCDKPYIGKVIDLCLTEKSVFFSLIVKHLPGLSSSADAASCMEEN
jgi:hypothetical protein